MLSFLPLGNGLRARYASGLITDHDDPSCGLCTSAISAGEFAAPMEPEHTHACHAQAVLATGEQWDIITDRYVPWLTPQLPRDGWNNPLEVVIPILEAAGYRIIASRRVRRAVA